MRAHSGIAYLMLCLILVSCTAALPASPTPTTAPAETSTPTATPAATSAAEETSVSQLDVPLAVSGPYAVGAREMKFVDQNRKARQIDTTVWYPALQETDDAAPDLSGAPYPLILYSHGMASSRWEHESLMRHLVSHGFVVAAMDHLGDTDYPYFNSVNRPLDVLFVLNQLASLSTGDLVGMIDADHTGVAGYSGGGFTVLALTGAREDIAYVKQWCATNSHIYPQMCFDPQALDQMTAYRYQFEPSSSVKDELWPPFTDKRIRAGMAMAGGPGPVFGERGLAAASVPTLLYIGTEDTDAPYEWAGVFVYQHLGSSDRYLISVIGEDHRAGGSALDRNLKHFATALFGYYLQGHKEYAQYLTEDYVNSVKGLAWGIYNGASGK